jgi:hypothetical protein
MAHQKAVSSIILQKTNINGMENNCIIGYYNMIKNIVNDVVE